MWLKRKIRPQVDADFKVLQGFHTVLTSSGRMKTMRKHRYQASSVPSRTIRCCLRRSP